MRQRFFLGSLACLLAVSCSVQELDFKESSASSDEVFYASLESYAAPETRVYVDENVKILWDSDDRISIFNKYTYNQEYRFAGATGSNAGAFKKVPTDDFVTGNDLEYVYAVYPYRDSTSVGNSGVLSLDLPTSQEYRDGSFGLGSNTMVSVTEDNQLKFKNVGGYLVLKFYGAGVSVSSISLEGNNGELLSGQATVSQVVGGVPSLTMSSNAGTSVSLTCETPVELGATKEEATQFWLVVPPTSFTKGFKLTVMASDGRQYVKETSANLSITRNGVLRISPIEVVLSSSEQPSMPEAVDLGLSVKWASFNLGANSPEEFGDYYAWGEIAPKSNYSWTNYKWCDGSSASMTKYCLDSSYGQVDGLSSLESQDDAATANLGNTWRIPTRDEWDELMNDCSWEWTSVGGIYGYLVSGKKEGFTDSSIFIPAAGIWKDTTFYPRNNSPWSVAGSYWTSDLGDSNIPYNIDFDTVCPYVDNLRDGYKYTGQSIRPVWVGAPEVITKDLSKNGTANSYIVASSGSYKFNATVKGNSSESVGSAASAEVMWESFGTNTAPQAGDIIASVALSDDGYVLFETPAELKDGNALIAVKDAAGTVLWSWHIWVCSSFDPEVSEQTYANNAGIMMDRNLGALSAAKGDNLSSGLLYQWGRKDPFMGSSSLTSSSLAKATPEFPAPKSSTATIEYTVNNPTIYVSLGSFDWLSSTDNDRWASEKTKYDPCPPGWKVPEGGPDGFYATAFGTSSPFSDNSYWNSSLHGVVFPASVSGSEAWYPATGARGWSDGRLVGVGELMQVYSSTTGEGSASYVMLVGTDGTVYPSSYCTSSSAYDYFHRVDARSVRCIKDGVVSPAVIHVSSISLSPSSLGLKVGDQSSLLVTVLPENAADKAVTWSSSNTAVAIVSSGGVVTGVKAGTATITATAHDGSGVKATCTVTVSNVAVTGVTLNKTTLSLVNGTSETLTATVAPTNATDKTVTWSSSNTSVATVDASGKVTALAGGSATITVKTADGSKTATCSVTVTVPVTGVSLNNTSLSMMRGSTQALTATITPSNATNKNVTWKSSNTSVATVDSSGKVTAVAGGAATITCTTNDGGFTASCSVTVKSFPEGNAFDEDAYITYVSNHQEWFNMSTDKSYVYDTNFSTNVTGTRFEMKFQIPDYSSKKAILSYCSEKGLAIDASNVYYFHDSRHHEDGDTWYDRSYVGGSESGVDGTGTVVLTASCEGDRIAVSVNGKGTTISTSVSSLNFQYIFSDYDYEGGDGSQYEYLAGVPEGAKLYYVKIWNGDSLVYFGHASRAVCSVSSEEEYCWYEEIGNKYTFARSLHTLTGSEMTPYSPISPIVTVRKPFGGGLD